jgi:hypothetical protein
MDLSGSDQYLLRHINALFEENLHSAPQIPITHKLYQ